MHQSTRGRPKYGQQVLRKVAAKFRAKWTGLLFPSRAACFDQSNYNLIRTDSGCSSRLAHQPHFGNRFATGTTDQPNPAPLCHVPQLKSLRTSITHSIIYYFIILFSLNFISHRPSRRLTTWSNASRWRGKKIDLCILFIVSLESRMDRFVNICSIGWQWFQLHSAGCVGVRMIKPVGRFTALL